MCPVSKYSKILGVSLQPFQGCLLSPRHFESGREDPGSRHLPEVLLPKNKKNISCFSRLFFLGIDIKCSLQMELLLTIELFIFQMRIIILYAFNWHNMYFDQVVLVLTTMDPLINHCVCLWTMSKYRDGYASSLGKVFSCFKPSEEGMFRSAITRLSSISRRSFSRSSSSARSSSMRTSRRKSCKLDKTNLTFKTLPLLQSMLGTGQKV